MDVPTPTAERTTARRPRRRLTVAGAVLAGAGLGVLLAAPAQAAGRLTLEDHHGRWVVVGTGLTPGPATAQVSVWRVRTAAAPGGVVDSQPVQVTPNAFFFGTFARGGEFTARGRQHWVPGAGLFPGHWANDVPLQCGVPYRATAWAPADGWLFSPVVTTPCPVLG
ncbi:hypothetical protein NUM3379_01810 [Kineococcus sp. NUM-3379]